MIQTRGLTKDFVVSSTETVHAVRGIDLDIAPGELVAVLGPNGAGKSTTMRMLTTLIRADRPAPRRSPASTSSRTRRPSGGTSATSGRATARATSSAPPTS